MLAERSIITGAEGRLTQQGRLKKTITVGEIAFVAGRIAAPVGPVDSLAARVPNAILELALRLPPEHGSQQHIGLLRLADDIVGGQEV